MSSIYSPNLLELFKLYTIKLYLTHGSVSFRVINSILFKGFIMFFLLKKLGISKFVNAMPSPFHIKMENVKGGVRLSYQDGKLEKVMVLPYSKEKVERYLKKLDIWSVSSDTTDFRWVPKASSVPFKAKLEYKQIERYTRNVKKGEKVRVWRKTNNRERQISMDQDKSCFHISSPLPFCSIIVFLEKKGFNQTIEHKEYVLLEK